MKATSRWYPDDQKPSELTTIITYSWAKSNRKRRRKWQKIRSQIVIIGCLLFVLVRIGHVLLVEATGLAEEAREEGVYRLEEAVVREKRTTKGVENVILEDEIGKLKTSRTVDGQLENVAGVDVQRCLLPQTAEPTWIEAVEYSGYKVLHGAAIFAVVKASPFPPFPESIGVPLLQMEVALRYVLE